jgi:hypothetical protein
MTTRLLKTSVVVDWDDPAVAAALADEAAVSTITLAELAAEPHLASTVSEGSRRQARLQQVEATFAPLPSTPAPRATMDTSSLRSPKGGDHIGAASRTCSSRQQPTPTGSLSTPATPAISPVSATSSRSFPCKHPARFCAIGARGMAANDVRSHSFDLERRSNSAV